MTIAELPLSTGHNLPTEISTGDNPRKRKTRSPWIRLLLTLIRRSHLYFGLLLVPWAILYGVTAYLFNHPSHFSTTVQESIAAADIPKEWATREWKAPERAQQVVDKLYARYANGSTAILLNNVIEPRFEGSSITSSYEYDGRSYSVSVAMNGQRGTMRSQPVRREVLSPETAFFEIAPPGTASRSRGRGVSPSAGGNPQGSSKETPRSNRDDAESAAIEASRTPLFIDESISERLKANIIEMAAKRGHAINEEQVRLTSIPEMVFTVRSDNEIWECRYSALTGAVSTRPLNAPSSVEFSWRRFFLRLHTAHAYPDEINARWFWAIVVDLMAFVMVFWGVSGIVMWWQIKSTRPSGSVAMAASLVAAVSLGIAMYNAF